MPTFDYVCGACGNEFEARVASARARPACSRCHARSAKRRPSAPAVRGSSRQAPTLRIGGKGARGCGLIERPDAAGPK